MLESVWLISYLLKDNMLLPLALNTDGALQVAHSRGPFTLYYKYSDIHQIFWFIFLLIHVTALSGNIFNIRGWWGDLESWQYQCYALPTELCKTAKILYWINHIFYIRDEMKGFSKVLISQGNCACWREKLNQWSDADGEGNLLQSQFYWLLLHIFCFLSKPTLSQSFDLWQKCMIKLVSQLSNLRQVKSGKNSSCCYLEKFVFFKRFASGTVWLRNIRGFRTVVWTCWDENWVYMWCDTLSFWGEKTTSSIHPSSC